MALSSSGGKNASKSPYCFQPEHLAFEASDCSGRVQPVKNSHMKSSPSPNIGGSVLPTSALVP